MHKNLFNLPGPLLLALLAGLPLAASGSPASSATAQPPLVINLKAEDIKFDGMSLTARVGQPVTLSFQNAGALEHSFVIEALNVKLEHVKAGQTATVTFTPTAAGTYEFY